MRKITRFIASVLVFCFLVSSSLPAYAADYKVVVITDPYVHEIGNELLTSYVDYENGRFLIASKQGKLSTPFDNYSLYLAESGVPYIEDGQLKTASGPESSYTTIRIDGVSYIFGNDYTGKVPNSSKAVCKKISDTVHETLWQVNGVEVTQRLELPADSLDKMAGVVKVSYRVENKSNKNIELGSRILLDTTVQNADNVVIFVADGNGEREIKRERSIDKDAMPNYWRAQTNYYGITDLDAVGILEGEGIEKPDKMIMGHWKGLSSSKFDYVADPELDFTVDDNVFGVADSGVALYWEDRQLNKGESFTFSTGYGLGLDAVSESMGRPDLFSYPVEVMLTEDGTDYQTFDVRIALENSLPYEVKNVRAGLNIDEEEVFFPEKIVEVGTGRVSTATRTISWDRVPKGEKRWATITVKVYKKFKEFTVQDFDIIVMYDDPQTKEQKYNLYNCRIGIPGVTTKVPEVKFTAVGPEYFYFESLSSFYIEGSGFEYLGERGSLDPVQVKMVNTEDPEDVIPIKMSAIRTDNLIWCYLPILQRFQRGADYQVTVSTERFGTYTFPTTLKASTMEKFKNKDYGIVAVYREPGSLEYKIKSFEEEAELLALYDQLGDKYIDDYYNMDTRYAYKESEEFIPLVIRGSAFGNDETGYRFPNGTIINGGVIYKTEDLSDQGGMRLTKIVSESESYILMEGDGQIDVGGNNFIDGRFQVKLVDGANYSLAYELPVGKDPSGKIDYGEDFDLVETYPANPVAIKQVESFKSILQYVGGFPIIVNDIMLRRDGASLSGYMGLFLPSNILPNRNAPPGESNKALITRILTDQRGSLGGGINVYDVRYRNTINSIGQSETKFFGIKTDASVAWPKNLIPMVEFGGNVRVMLDTLEKSVGVSGEVSFTVLRAKGLFKAVLIKMVPVPDSIGVEISGKIPVPLVPPIPIVSIIRGGGYIENFALSVGEGLLENWNDIAADEVVSATLIVGIADPSGNVISGDPLKLKLSPLGLSASGTLNLFGLTLGEAIYKMDWTARTQNGDTKAKVGASIEGRTSILDVLTGSLQLFAGINEVNVNNPIYPLEIGGKGKLSGSILGVKLANAYAGVNNSYVYARGNFLGYDVGIKYYWQTGKVGIASVDDSKYTVKGNAGESIVIDNFKQLDSSKNESGSFAALASAGKQHDFVINQPVDALLKVLYSGDTPDIAITRPDGTDYVLNEGVNYLATQEGEQKMVYISLPQAEVGTWRLNAERPVEYELIGVESLPEIKSIEVKKQEGNTVTLAYDTDKGSGTTFKFYLAAAKDEVGSIVGEAAITEDIGTIDLELPEGINGGSYYLRAEMLSNDANIDESYTDRQVVVINPNTPSAPLGVTVENAGNNNIKVNWSSEDPITDGYFIEFCDVNGKRLTDGAAMVEKNEDSQEALVRGKWKNNGEESGLALGQSFKVAVTAFNEVTLDGDSESITYTSQPIYSNVIEFREADPPVLNYSLSNSGGALEEAEVSGQAGFISKEQEITVNCTADQNAQVIIYANKEVIAVAPGGSAEETVSLSEGNNELVVKAINGAGDTSEEVIYVMLDTQPPLLMVKSPEPGEVCETNTIKVEGTAEQGSAVTVNGVPVSTDTNGLFSTEISFGDLQKKALTIKAKDMAGNTTEYETEVGRDIGKELMLTYIDTAADTLELGQPVHLKLYGVYEDNSVREINNSSVQWSIVQGNGAATVGEDGVLTVYGISQVYVKADYQVAVDYTLQDVKVFSPGEITHDSPEYKPAPPIDDSNHSSKRRIITKNTVTVEANLVKNYLHPETNTIIIPKTNSNAPVQEFVLTKSALNSILDILAQSPGADGSIYLKTDDVSIKIPEEVLTEAASVGLTVSVETLDNQKRMEALDAVDSGMNSIGPVLELEINAEGEAIKEFKKKVKIEFKLAGSDLAGIDISRLGIYYLDEGQNKWVYVGGKYNPETGYIEAETGHFTKFTVMETRKSFADAMNSWAKDYIEILAARHITEGIDENNFGVGQKVTRAQFATFLVRALGIETSPYAGNFKDCKLDSWYTPFVEAANQKGLINGIGNGLFNPNVSITREQMAAMLIRAYQYMQGTELSDETVQQASGFNDMETVSPWAVDYVKAVQVLGLMSGNPDGTFAPKSSALREEVAKVLVLLVK